MRERELKEDEYVCMYAYVCIRFHTKTTTGREKEEKKKNVKQIIVKKLAE